MKSFTTILLSLALSFGGLYSQLDAVLHPQDYHMIDLPRTEVPAPLDAPAEDTFIQLPQVRMHYQIWGDGEKPPLILVHGNGGSVRSLDEAASYFANDYTVYLPESRCHGQSSDPGEISYEAMAQDLCDFIAALGLEKPVLIGHSDGAIDVIALAAMAPEVPGAVIACGANSRPETFKPYFPIGVALRNLFKHDKLNDLMLEEPDFTPELLSKITCPTYVVSGQYDIMWVSDTRYLGEQIPGSDWVILRGEQHSTYMSQNGAKTYALARPWLTEKGL
ncbi:MAG: alpha/beta hydrolase [Clostridia bacterium]|nr:alpha/beta hydrolase [Clostridia bacterium]